MSDKKILVVDDDRVYLKAASNLLKSWGYHVITAADGGSAVSAARLERPDLIMMDLIFPPDVANGGGVAWDGFLLMNWIRRMCDGQDVPVIVVTSADPEQYQQKAFDQGAIAFCQKPLDPESLCAFIRQTFGEEAPAPVEPAQT